MKSNTEQSGVLTLWEKYAKTHRKDIRNQIIEHYLPVVKNIADKLVMHLPDSVSVDDLISMGSMGLFQKGLAVSAPRSTPV